MQDRGSSVSALPCINQMGYSHASMAATKQKSEISITRKRPGRLTKELWLERSIHLLEKRGPTAMTIESLTRHLGVTTGSFYWHFKSHAGFLGELTDKYIQDYTYVLSDHLAALDLPPRELLLEAMREIITIGLGGMDLHFRSLAISYPSLAAKIRAMDKHRTSTITDLFRGMGYTGDELRMRVHIFVILHSMEHAMITGLPPKDRLKLLEERTKLLVD